MLITTANQKEDRKKNWDICLKTREKLLLNVLFFFFLNSLAGGDPLQFGVFYMFLFSLDGRTYVFF